MIKRLRQLLFHRVTIVVLFILIQLLILGGMIWQFDQYFVYFYAVSVLISAVITLEIINNRDNPAYKIAWIIPILILPLFGWMLYLVFGRNRFWPREQARIKAMRDRIHACLPDNGVLDELAEVSPSAANQSRYIERYSYTHPSKNTYSEYFPLGELAFERMKQEFEKAKRYIFLEYFIVEEGVMWNELLEILVRKAKAGVDVRLIYDDMGCIFTLPFRYDKKLRKLGIQCERFAPFSPELSSRFNNRSHRKIAVVDGHTAFTGGINLADEYINAVVKFGHWKDTAILLQGDAAWTMTAMFLSMWDYVTGIRENYCDFTPSETPLSVSPCSGYVQPYFDSPLDGESVSETIYMNIIAKAERYVYITTP
jgi:cardiolipin synthase